MITESKLLVFYDQTKPVLLSFDSSLYGVGAVISHIMKDGSERPIPFHPEPYVKQRGVMPKLRRKLYR